MARGIDPRSAAGPVFRSGSVMHLCGMHIAGAIFVASWLFRRDSHFCTHSARMTLEGLMHSTALETASAVAAKARA